MGKELALLCFIFTIISAASWAVTAQECLPYIPPPPLAPAKIQQWLDSSFIGGFVQFLDIPPAEPPTAAMVLAMKAPILTETPVNSTLTQNITLAAMKNLVKESYHAILIPGGEYISQLALLNGTYNSSTFLKTVREHVLHTGEGEIVYGLTGLLQLGKKHGVRGTVIRAFRRFKLNIALPRGGLRYGQSKDCIMWNTFCRIHVSKFGNMEKALIPGVLSYMQGFQNTCVF